MKAMVPEGKLIPRDTTLTKAFGETAERSHSRSYLGQAHFAVGPYHCGNCTFYESYRCRKNKKFNRGKTGAKFPPCALSCHYFEPREGA